MQKSISNQSFTNFLLRKLRSQVRPEDTIVERDTQYANMVWVRREGARACRNRMGRGYDVSWSCYADYVPSPNLRDLRGVK
jgi:hypothetical protein